MIIQASIFPKYLQLDAMSSKLVNIIKKKFVTLKNGWNFNFQHTLTFQ